MIRVDGRGQVLEMLRAADPIFREILLRGIEKRDAQLARELAPRALRSGKAAPVAQATRADHDIRLVKELHSREQNGRPCHDDIRPARSHQWICLAPLLSVDCKRLVHITHQAAVHSIAIKLFGFKVRHALAHAGKRGRRAGNARPLLLAQLALE
jgi:hypothetical protein